MKIRNKDLSILISTTLNHHTTNNSKPVAERSRSHKTMTESLKNIGNIQQSVISTTLNHRSTTLNHRTKINTKPVAERPPAGRAGSRSHNPKEHIPKPNSQSHTKS